MRPSVRARNTRFIAMWILATLLPSISFAQNAAPPETGSTPSTPPPVHWQPGPMTAKLGNLAEIQVPQGYLFADGPNTIKLLELTHNIASGREVGTVVPAGEGPEDSWFVVFEFDDMGYVKDDEKDKIDADALLKSIREGTEESNKVRKEKGWNTMSVVGWEKPPYYDQATNNLTWAIRGASSAGGESINHSLRILGRHGTMNVDLIQDPQYYANAVPRFESVMGGFKFTEGHRYADFVKGDKVAAYGLSALVLGGAGAAAVKTGLFAKFWKVIVGALLAFKKLIVVLVIGIGALFKKIMNAISGRREIPQVDETPPTPGT